METTRISSPDFTVTLPGAWAEKRRGEGMELVSADEAQQLGVSVVTWSRPTDVVERRAAVDRLVEERDKAFARRSRGVGRLMRTERRDDGESSLVTLVGVDGVKGVLAYVRIVATPERVVTASLYRQGGIKDPTGFARDAEELCGALAVTDGVPLVATPTLAPAVTPALAPGATRRGPDYVLYARVWPRVKAILIDGAILAAAFVVAASVGAKLTGSGPGAFMVWVAFWILYDPLMVSRTGGTLGHRWQNLRVVSDRTGGRPSLLAAFVRNVAKGLLGAVSLLAMSGSSRGKALHDWIAGTTVQARDAEVARLRNFTRVRRPTPGGAR